MKAFVTALFLILSTPIMYGQKSVHPGGMHTREQIKATQQMIKKKDPTYLAAYHQLLVLADSTFKHPYHALENYAVRVFYAAAHVHRTNSWPLQSDAFDAYACALAYQLSGNKK